MHKRNICLITTLIICFGILLFGSTRTFAATVCNTDSETGLITCTNSITASVTIPASCSLTRINDYDSNSGYETNLANGATAEIDGSSFKTLCNDANGFAIYAIGYSNDEIGNTDLISNISSDYNIKTDGANSNWRMRVIALDYDSYIPTIENDFDDFSNIPSSYTKIASYNTITTDGSVADGSKIHIAYQATASTTQPAGTYTGKVKYVLLHPSSLEPTTIEQAYENNGKTKVETVNPFDGSIGYYYTMQDMNDTICSEVNLYGSASETELVDIRDNKTYYVTKLADGNCWMTENLDHDIVTTPNFYTSENTDIPANKSPLTMNTATYTTNTAWNSSTTTPRSYDPGDLCWNGNLNTNWDGTLANMTIPCTDSSANKHYSIGNYYNWTAAVAMNDSSSYTTNRQDVNQSICPAGWRLPTYSGDKSYQNLVDTLGLTAGTSGNIQNSPVYFAYGGGWGGDSWDVGGGGYYWSGLVYGDWSAHSMDFNVYGYLTPQGGGARGLGFPVRCVAR